MKTIGGSALVLGGDGVDGVGGSGADRCGGAGD